MDELFPPICGIGAEEQRRILARMRSVDYYAVGWGGPIVGLNQLPPKDGAAVLKAFRKRGWIWTYVAGDVRHWTLTQAGRGIAATKAN